MQNGLALRNRQAHQGFLPQRRAQQAGGAGNGGRFLRPCRIFCQASPEGRPVAGGNLAKHSGREGRVVRSGSHSVEE
jgi:hypothetical protein